MHAFALFCLAFGSGVVSKDLHVGSGPLPRAGDYVTIDYTAKAVGKTYETTQGKAPLRFQLGKGDVIDGLDQGVAGMKLGGTRLITIPPDLAFGDLAMEGLPPDSSLLVTAHLLRIERKSDKPMIEITEITPGHGETPAKAGDQAEIHYIGTFVNGTKFDSSRDRNQTFTFKLGAGRVIKGFDMAVTGMKVGQRRKVTIPPEFGYGDKGAGDVIPPGATLVFDIELISINGKKS